MGNTPVYTHATAPAPIITVTSGEPRVLLSGIVFAWWGKCELCRRTIDLYVDGGQILIELRTGEGDERGRWLREHRASRPDIPRRCPACGEEKWQQPGSFETPTSSSVNVVGWAADAAVQAVYAQLNVDFPYAAEATGKDQYDMIVIERTGGS